MALTKVTWWLSKSWMTLILNEKQIKRALVTWWRWVEEKYLAQKFKNWF